MLMALDDIHDGRDHDDPSVALGRRVAALEATLAELTREVSVLRSEVRDRPAVSPLMSRAVRLTAPEPAALAAPAAIPAAARRRPPWMDRRSYDLEGLLGRYGMLGIATVAALAALVTFLGWAISQGYLTLGPARRVGLGLTTAVAIAIWGFRLRRTERSFGSSLIGLALAIVHVCAYAAGPWLGLVPPPVALALAVLASSALTTFAHAEGDQPLWCVGFGGAAIAPFLVHGESASVYLLAIFGASVLLAGCYSIAGRAWKVAWAIWYVSAALFTLVVASMEPIGRRGEIVVDGPLIALALAFIVALGGVIPFAAGDRKRSALRWLWMLGIATAFMEARDGPNPVLHAVIYLAAAGVILLLAGRVAQPVGGGADDRAPTTSAPPSLSHWTDIAGIPLLFIFAATTHLTTPFAVRAIFASAALAFLAFAIVRPLRAARDPAALGATVCLAVLAADIGTGGSVVISGAAIALGLLLLVLHRGWPSIPWLIGALASLVLAVMFAGADLATRPSYQYQPFLTQASALAATVVLTLALLSRARSVIIRATTSALGALEPSQGVRGLERVLVAAPWVSAFFWALIELAWAFDRSTSTVLVVVYFAVTGVAAVAAGRARGRALVRQIGLGLALAAAATAFFGASNHLGVGSRILAYLATSVFLLGIAYWYRRPGVGAAATESDPPRRPLGNASAAPSEP
jgi:Predicted membrane protein (DUF2339)